MAAAVAGQQQQRQLGGHLGSSGLHGKACRVHLVGVFSGGQYVHLGPYTLPAEGDCPSLLEFATTMKRLITVNQGQDTWWRLEYTCYGNPVPILSDDALKEAFAYFREQHINLSPEAAAAACRLYLTPTASQPPWTLTDYLTETRIAPSLNPPGSQLSGDQAALNPEPSDAGTGAAVVAAAAAAAGGRGVSGDGASSSSSSHEAQEQQQTVVAPAAAAGAPALKQQHSGLPRVLLAAADNGSFSARKQPPAWSSGGSLSNQQQQQQQTSDAAAAPRAAKRHAAGAIGSTEQVWEAAQQQQQQQQQGLAPSATASKQHGLMLQRNEGAEGSGGDPRGSKAAKRDSDSSPRSQWQQQHPMAAGPGGFEPQQQQQQQQPGGYVSPFAAAAGPCVAGVNAGDPMAAALQQQQQQQLQLQHSGLLQRMPSSFGGSLTHSQDLAARSQQQQQQQCSGAAAWQQATAGAIGPGLPAAMMGQQHQAGPDSDHEGGGEACSIASHLDQLQQLHLSNYTNNSGMPPAGLRSSMSGAALDSQQQQQQQAWMLAAQQQQQQLLLANNNQLAAQLGGQGGFSMVAHGSSGDLAAAVLAGSAVNTASNVDMAAAAAAQAGGGRSSRSAAAAAAGDGGLQGLQLSLAGSRAKTETKTKYADGRFKDEARHQQRLADMKARCDALFDGAIADNFRIEHHKRVTCLVCNNTVVPYEAYHIDAIRKHFVRHHEPWLAERGVDVDVWRKSCAPISKGLGAARGSASSSSSAAKPAAAAAVAAAAGDGLSAMSAGDEAAGEDEEGAGRKASGTRHADGRYKDPQQHQQRLADMQARCAALFNGTMTQHWSINSHKSITCHLCSQNITPYAAYHPDCLRKHFVRRHEDVLVAAGVDVSAWSKGIPMGRRKLKALLQQQLLQQQQQLLQQQQQQQMSPELLLQMQPMQQQMQLQQLQGLPQAALLQPVGADSAVQQQQQQQQLMMLQMNGQPGAWSWAPVQQQQLQQQQQQQQQQQVFIKRSSSSGQVLLSPAEQQQQQHVVQLIPAGVGMAAVAGPSALQVPGELSDMPLVSPPGSGQQPAPTPVLPMMQQQLASLQHSGFAAAPAVSAGQVLQPMQLQQPAAAAAPGQAFGSPAIAASPDAQAPAAPPAAVAVVQFAQPHELRAPSMYGSSTVTMPPVDSSATPCMPMEGLGEPQTSPASLDTDAQAQQQQQQQQQPQQQEPRVQAQHEPPRARSSRSALAPALAAAAQQQQAAGNTQGAAGQQSRPEGSTADWARSIAEACGFGPMSLGQTPGFGPMSLSPAMGLQELGMGGVGSLTEADVAAMWDDDEEQDAALAEVLLKQGPWSFER